MVSESDEGFARFVALRSPALQRTAYLLAGDAGAAEDLVREALTRTCLAWPRLRDPHRAEELARTVVVREAIDRGQRRERPTPAPPAPPALPVDREADADDPDDAGARLWLALSLLPVRQRAAVVLRHHQELTEREIAEVLGCGVRTAERELAAALAQLRLSVGPEVASEELPR